VGKDVHCHYNGMALLAWLIRHLNDATLFCLRNPDAGIR
jgi:hypothetical protein